MDSIVEIIESRLEGGTAKTEFTYLRDGEDDAVSISLHEMRNYARNLSSALPSGEPVLVMLPQGLSFVTAFFSCMYSGAIAVPVAIPTKIRGEALLQNILTDTNAGGIITDRRTYSKVSKWFGEEMFDGIDPHFVEDFENEVSIDGTIQIPKAEQSAFIQYTSGSTGKPKGVVISHENITANSKFICDHAGHTEESVGIGWLPSFHDMGLIAGVLQPVFANFSMVTMSPSHFIQKPARWFSAISKYRGTSSGAPNFAFDYCCNRVKDDELDGLDLSTLESMYNGSEPIQPSSLERFVSRFGPVGFSERSFVTCYGLAEATLAVSISSIGAKPSVLRVSEKALADDRVEPAKGDDQSRILVSSGSPDPESRVMVVRPDTLEECGENEIGEIIVAGKSVAAGYHNQHADDDDVFFDIESQRALRTGDLGFLEDGELYVTGRIKDLIIVRGRNHYPQDIERTVSDSHESLRADSCAAFPVNADGGEKVVVVQEVDRNYTRDIDADQVLTSILHAVSGEHGIQPYEIVLAKHGSVPKTTSGKIRRAECKKLWASDKLDRIATYADKSFSHQA